MNVRILCVYVLLVLCLSAVFGCSGAPDLLQEISTVAQASPTSISSATVKPIVEEPTITVEPTYTSTPEPTLTPTVTLVPTATRSSIVWDLNQFGYYYGVVGSWIVSVYSDPQLPRENDSIAQLLVQFEYHKDTNVWTGPVEMLDPAAVCQWTFDKLAEGYGLVMVVDGKLIETRTREERWLEFSSAVGDSNKEPYCPQFDSTLGVPVFDTTD